MTERALIKKYVADGAGMALPYRESVKQLMESELYQKSTFEQRRELLEYNHKKYLDRATMIVEGMGGAM